MSNSERHRVGRATHSALSAPDRETVYWPLTEPQEGLWYAQRLDPANPVFNTAQCVDIRGPLDLTAFRDAVEEALREADGLSVRVTESPDGPTLVVDPSARALLWVIDVSREKNPEGAARSWMEHDLETPLDLERDLLVAQTLFVLAPDRHLWYQRVHHVVIDGYGTWLLTNRVCELYRAAVTGESGSVSQLGSFADVIANDTEYRTSAKRETDRQFWRDSFQDAPNVAGLVSGPALTARRYRRCVSDLAGSAAQDLQLVSERSGVPWPDVLTALAAAYVARHIGRADVCVGVATMNRFGTPAARVPAMVMNVLPVWIGIDERAGIDQWLGDVSKTLRKARRHGRYRSEQLRRDLGLLGGNRRLYGPLINVLPFDETPGLTGLETTLEVLATGPVDDLTITLRADAAGHGVRLELDANPNLYTEEDINAHAARLGAFVSAGLRAEALNEVASVSPDEYQRYVVDVNDTAHEIPNTTLTALIEATFQSSPDAVAVVADDRTVTYRELDRLSAQLANTLRNAGVEPGHIVALAFRRSLELIVSLVGVLRAGGAYLPLDPEYPTERLARTIALATPTVVLTTEALASRLPDNATALTVACEGGQCVTRSVRGEPSSRQPGDSRPAALSPADAAYVIYTSGSTGDPKGVVIEHLSIVNRLEWMRTHYGIDSSDRILHKTPVTFDVSVWELFLPLVTGAVLVVAPPDAHRDPSWLASIIRDEQITTMHFVPSMLDVFLAEPAAARIQMRRVFVSGEALPAGLRDRFHRTMDAELHNLYGPTEAAVDVTYWNASRDDRSSPVPIGRPVWNTRMYILDAASRPLPPGVAGDLYIAGIQVAREYLGRPDLTAERFVPDPFVPGARMYRTGDLAQWRRDAEIEFLGRSDHQVKIRGLRVELGEIETAIVAHAPVRQAVVLLREDRPGDQRLVGYVVPVDGGSTLNVSGLRSRLEAVVPSYMVPSAFVVLDELPLSRNGKLDRGVLPSPGRVEGSGRPLETSTEHRVAELMADVLGLAEWTPAATLSGDDDFFSLGGHSLLAARLMLKIRQELAVDLALGAIFANPTVSALAGHVDAARAAIDIAELDLDTGLGVIIPLVRSDAHAPRLFCIHPAGGLSWCYSTLARALEIPVAVYGVQARGLDPTAKLPDRLDDIALDYVNEILTIQSEGPFHLCGWSVGGIIAHAMAVQLEALGHEVGVLAMLDAYPCDRWRNEAPPDERIALKALLLVAGVDPASLAEATLARESVVAYLRSTGHPLGYLSDGTLSGIVRVVSHNSRLVRSHRHEAVNAGLVYFRAALDHQGLDLNPQEWKPYVHGAIEVYDLPSMHAHLTGPDASRQIAAVLGPRIAQSSATARPRS